MDNQPDHIALVSLHRYWIRANRMSELFKKELKDPRWQLPADATDDEKNLFILQFSINDPGIYMSLFYGALFVVVEGWKDLKLEDPIIDQMLNNPDLVSLLRLYRNGTFHFQRNPFDQRFVGFMDHEKSADWVKKLNREFGRFFSNCFGISEAN